MELEVETKGNVPLRSHLRDVIRHLGFESAPVLMRLGTSGRATFAGALSAAQEGIDVDRILAALPLPIRADQV